MVPILTHLMQQCQHNACYIQQGSLPSWGKGIFFPLSSGKPPLGHRVYFMSSIIGACLHGPMKADQDQEGGLDAAGAATSQTHPFLVPINHSSMPPLPPTQLSDHNSIRLKLTCRQDLLLHHAFILFIFYRQPVLYQEKVHIVCLLVPYNDMLQIPRRAQTWT